MQIRIKLPNTQSYHTAQVREGANLSLQVRDNLTLEGSGRLLDIDLDFAITYENEAAFEFAHIAHATTDLRNNTVTAYLQDGISEIEGEFTLTKTSVKACNEVQYFGTFSTQGATWYNALLKLCEYDYGNATQNGASIINTFSAQAWQVGDSPLFYHSLYYTKPQTANNLNTMEAIPSVFLRAIIEPIILQIESLGFTVDAPFFDTLFFRNLLLHNFVGWDLVKNIYASEVDIKASYRFDRASPSSRLVFVPFFAANATQTQAGLLVQASTPVNFVIPFFVELGFTTVGGGSPGAGSGANANVVKFVVPETGYYKITGRYKGSRVPFGNRKVGFFASINNSQTNYLGSSSSGGSTFDLYINSTILLQQGDFIYWFTIEEEDAESRSTFCTMDFEKYKYLPPNVYDFKINSLFPCDTAADMLKGLTTMFNLAVFTKNKVVTIAPFYTATLLTGELVQGFYRLQGNNEIKPNRVFEVGYGANGQLSSDYFFSYKDDSKDANIQKGQLFSSHILYPKSPEPQRRLDNSYFAPTYSKDGTCYLIDKTIGTPDTQWGAASYDHTPRILYRHGKITRAWNFNGVNLGYMPSAFMADDVLEMSYLPYNNRNNELGLANRFWARWADFVQNALAYQFEHAQILYTQIDMRSLVHLYGRYWIIDEVQNIQLGCDSDEPMTIKLLTFNP